MFKGKAKPFNINNRILLASPTMHEEEKQYVKAAFASGWVTTVGENINAVEKALADYVGIEYAVGLSSGTAALHLAIRLAATKLYFPHPLKGSLAGKKVFCSNLTFDATVNPIVYEGGEPVFIDSEYETWNMSPGALEKAFQLFPEVKLVVVANLYGTPSRIDELEKICEQHNALLIEDAAESLGAKYKSAQTGSQADISIVSFNGNKIVTGSCGGAVLVHEKADADRIRKWSTQSREATPWYQHEEIGFNYRMSNIVAGIVRGQLEHIGEHIEKKREIYERYKEGMKGLPVHLNPWDEQNSSPNFWLSCITVDKEYMAPQVRSGREALYTPTSGKSCPTEIMNALAAFNIESRPIWKPMSQQPIYQNSLYITSDGIHRGNSNAYIEMEQGVDCSADVFSRGLCLPSDIKMESWEQERVIEVVKECFE